MILATTKVEDVDRFVEIFEFAQPIRIEYTEPNVRARLVWPLSTP
jgi:hypothetical protein